MNATGREIATAERDGGGAAPSPLAERAWHLLQSSEHGLSTAELVSGVFGSGSSGPWPAILDQILTGDPRFERSDERWRVTARGPVSLRGELVALAVATTGADPRRNRVVRCSAARFDGPTVISRFDVAINPGRRLAGYLSRAARFSQEEADEAPAFGEVADRLREFLGDSPIVAYGARRLVDLLDAELARVELPRLENRLIELDQLTSRVLPERRKPSLPAVAEQLGISHPRPSYPPADADVIARVTAALLRIAAEQGAEDVLADQPPNGVPIEPRPALLDRRWLAGVPDGPGVYVVEDDAGSVLYVGKASSLRRRLATYFGRSFGLHRQLEALAARASRVRTEPTGSDLEARLLEARLIRQHRPPFNVARRLRPRSLLIRCAAHDPVPHVGLARAAAADGALYVGPARSERAARQGVQLVRAIFPLAVLRRAVEPPAQREAVQAAIRLLTGQRDEALEILRAAMTASSRHGDHARVDACRRLIETVLQFELRASPLLGTSPLEPLLVVEPAAADRSRRVHLIEHGHLVSSMSLADEDDPHEPATLSATLGELQARRRQPDHEEDAYLVTQWLGELDARYVVLSASELRRLGLSAPLAAQPGPSTTKASELPCHSAQAPAKMSFHRR